MYFPLVRRAVSGPANLRLTLPQVPWPKLVLVAVGFLEVASEVGCHPLVVVSMIIYRQDLANGQHRLVLMRTLWALPATLYPPIPAH